MWVVMTSSAKPVGRFGQYGNVAVVKLSQHYTANNLRPKMISMRARGVLDLRYLGKHSMGKTERCAYQRAMARARQLASELNAQSPIAQGEYLMSWGGSA